MPPAPNPDKPWRWSLPALAAFSLPGLPLGALVVALPVYLPRYYVTHYGLGLTAVGLAFMAVRLVDMGVDPVVGLLMDRTRTRLGRYRIWLCAAAPLLMLTVWSLFLPPAKVSYAYLVGWLFVFYIATSMITLAHASWASVVAARYHERSRVFGAIQITSTLAAGVVPLIPIWAHSGAMSGVRAMGLFIVAGTPLGIALAVACTPEPMRQGLGRHLRLRDYWAMARRPDMRRIVIADFCLQLGPNWMSTLYLFYFHDARGFSIDAASALLLAYIGAGVPGAAVMSWLATRLGKHRTQQIACIGYSVGLCFLGFLPRASVAFAAPFMAVMGFLAASFPLLDRAMVADVGDAVRLEQGENRVGVLYAMITGVQKIANALSVGLTFTLLGWIGYQAREGATNTPAAVHGLEAVFLAGPIVFVLLGGACYLGYRLDAVRHGEIRAALEARDAAAQALTVEPGP